MKHLPTFRLETFIVLFAIPILMAGCSHDKPKTDNSASDSPATSGDSNFMSSDQGNAYGLQTVHFAFDSQLLDDSNKSILKSDKEILDTRSQVRIQIEGHCDNRGGVQFNIALGEKRAQAVKHYLEDLGVAPNRITTISYGKERPIDTAETEEAYAKNRRANFVVTKSN